MTHDAALAQGFPSSASSASSVLSVNRRLRKARSPVRGVSVKGGCAANEDPGALLRQQREHALAGTGNHVRGNQPPEAFHLGFAGVHGGANGRYIAFDENG